LHQGSSLVAVVILEAEVPSCLFDGDAFCLHKHAKGASVVIYEPPQPVRTSLVFLTTVERHNDGVRVNRGQQCLGDGFFLPIKPGRISFAHLCKRSHPPTD